MTHRRLAVSLVGALVILGTAPLYADHGGKKVGHRASVKHLFFKKAHFILTNQQALGLSNEQVDSIKDLMRETKKVLIRQGADVDIVAVDLMAGLKADVVDVEAVHALSDQKFALKADKTKTAVEGYAKLKGLLTEAQRDTMHDLWLEKQSSRSDSHSKSSSTQAKVPGTFFFFAT